LAWCAADADLGAHIGEPTFAIIQHQLVQQPNSSENYVLIPVTINIANCDSRGHRLGVEQLER
jgi:hypothetical protein